MGMLYQGRTKAALVIVPVEQALLVQEDKPDKLAPAAMAYRAAAAASVHDQIPLVE